MWFFPPCCPVQVLSCALCLHHVFFIWTNKDDDDDDEHRLEHSWIFPDYLSDYGCWPNSLPGSDFCSTIRPLCFQVLWCWLGWHCLSLSTPKPCIDTLRIFVGHTTRQFRALQLGPLISCLSVLHFHVLLFGPPFSCPAISCPSFSAPPAAVTFLWARGYICSHKA